MASIMAARDLQAQRGRKQVAERGPLDGHPDERDGARRGVIERGADLEDAVAPDPGALPRHGHETRAPMSALASGPGTSRATRRSSSRSRAMDGAAAAWLHAFEDLEPR